MFCIFNSKYKYCSTSVLLDRTFCTQYDTHMPKHIYQVILINQLYGYINVIMCSKHSFACCWKFCSIVSCVSFFLLIHFCFTVNVKISLSIPLTMSAWSAKSKWMWLLKVILWCKRKTTCIYFARAFQREWFILIMQLWDRIDQIWLNYSTQKSHDLAQNMYNVVVVAAAATNWLLPQMRFMGSYSS